MNENHENLQSWWKLCNGRLEPDETIKLPVLSGSMRPLMAPETDIEIRAATWRSCEAGDIVVLRLGDGLTAHRLLLKIPVGAGAVCFQKGDVNRRGAWVSGERIVGIVVSSVDENGRKHEFLSSAARMPAAQQASAGLRGDFMDRLLTLPRRIKRWLTAR